MTQEVERRLRIIRKSNGHIFSCIFVKKDNTLRKMVARLGVRKGVSGEGMSWNPLDRDMIPAYDMQKRDWRMINLNSMVQARVNGVQYNFHYPIERE